jgi:prepilin-type N-terminal cleavage/methylation domain-containing protein/prepilin-type processing-associated H-X9-DG protein
MYVMRRRQAFIPLEISRRGQRPESSGPITRGFTLIELLVVIAIIALLMAILVPILERLRNEGRRIVCQSNLRQWSLIFEMYTNDNNGYFPEWSIRGVLWMHRLTAYDDGVNGMRCCPRATVPAYRKTPYGGTFVAWGPLPHTYAEQGLEGAFGSYGINTWVCRPGESDVVDGRKYWRKADVSNAAYVPVYLDAHCLHKAPRDTDEPLHVDDDVTRAWSDGVNHFCINRHDGYVNGLFMDWSARKIGLKELWTLKWHREFNTVNRWTRAGGVHQGDWPEWLKEFKDY